MALASNISAIFLSKKKLIIYYIYICKIVIYYNISVKEYKALVLLKVRIQFYFLVEVQITTYTIPTYNNKNSLNFLF